EERALEVEPGLEPANGTGMGRVEDVEAGDAEGPAQHLGREAGAAHPEQDDVLEIAVEGLELRDPLEHAARLVEPTEPMCLVRPAPDRGIAGPDPVDELDCLERAHPRKSSTRRSNSSGRSRLGTCAVAAVVARCACGTEAA